MPRIKAAAKPSTRGAGGKGRGRTAQLKDDSPTAPPENTADEPVIPDSIPRKRGRKPKDSTAEALDKAAIAKPTAASARGRAKKVVTPVDDEPPAKKMRKAKDSIADSMAPEAPKKTTTAKRTATASRGRAKKVVTPVEDKPPAKRGRKAKDPVPDNVVPEAPTEAVIAQPAVVASRGRAKKAVLPVDVEAPAKRGRKAKDPVAASAVPEAPTEAVIAQPTVVASRGRARKALVPAEVEAPAKRGRKPKNPAVDITTPKALSKTATVKPTTATTRGRAKKVVTPIDAEAPAKRGRKTKDPAADSVAVETPGKTATVKPTTTATRGRAKKAVTPVEDRPPAKRGRKAKDPVADSVAPEAPTEAVIAQPTVVASRGRARKAMLSVEDKLPAKRGRKVKDPLAVDVAAEAPTEATVARSTSATGRGRPKKIVLPVEDRPSAKRGRKAKDSTDDIVAPEAPKKTTTAESTAATSRGRPKKIVPPVEDKLPAKRGRKAKDLAADTVAPEAPIETATVKSAAAANRGRAKKVVAPVENKLPAKRGRQAKDSADDGAVPETPAEAPTAKSTLATGRGRAKKDKLSVDDEPPAKRIRKTKDSITDSSAPEAPHMSVIAQLTAAASRGRAKKGVLSVDDESTARRTRAQSRTNALDTAEPTATEMPPAEDGQASGKGRGRGKSVGRGRGRGRGQALKIVDFFSAGVSVDISVSESSDNASEAPYSDNASEILSDGIASDTTSSRGRGRGRGKSSVSARGSGRSKSRGRGRGQGRGQSLNRAESPNPIDTQDTTDTIADDVIPDQHEEQSDRLDHSDKGPSFDPNIVHHVPIRKSLRASARTGSSAQLPEDDSVTSPPSPRIFSKPLPLLLPRRSPSLSPSISTADKPDGVHGEDGITQQTRQTDTSPASQPAVDIATPTKSKRGRKLGSKNKPKAIEPQNSDVSTSNAMSNPKSPNRLLRRSQAKLSWKSPTLKSTLKSASVSNQDGEPIAETGADDDDDDDDAYYNVDHDHDGDDDDNDDGERQDIIGNGNGDDPIVLEDDDYRPLPKGYVKKGKGSRGKGRENRGAARAREGSSINKDPDSRPSRKNSKSVRQSLLPLETRAPTIIGLNMPNRSNRCNRFVCEDISTRITKSGKAWNGPIQDLHYVNNNYIDIGLDQDAWALLRAIRFKRSAVRIENDPRLLEAYLPPGCAELSSCSNADQDRDQASRLNIRQIDESMKPAEDSPPLSLRPLEILEKPNKPKSGWVANAGQSVWSIDWVPVRHESTEDMPSDVFVSDHIAVGGMTPGSNARECANVAYIERDNLNTPGIVQIWRVSTVIDAALHTSTSKDCTLDMVLLHKFGNCLALKWCPMSLAPPQPVTDTTDTGSGEDGDSVNSSHGDFLPILGLLAAVFADGYLRVCAVPQPNAIRGQPLQSDSTTRPVYMHWPEHSLVEIKPYHDRYTTLDWAGVDTIVAGSAKGLVSAWSLLACIKAQYAAACSGDAGGRDKWPYEMPIEQLVSDDEDVDQALHQAVPIVNHQMHRGIIFNIAAVCNDVGLRTQENLVRQRDDFSRLDPATILISSAGRDCRLRTFPLAFPTRTNHYLASEPGYIHAHHMYWLDFGYTHCDSLGVMRKNSEAFLVSNCTSDPWMRAALKNDTLSAHIGSAESDPAAKHFSSRWNSGSGRGSNILMNLGAPLMCICYSDFHVFAAAASCDGSLILQNIAIKGSSFKRYVSLRRVYTLLWDPVVANANNAVCADDQDDDASHPLVVPEQSERRLACLDGDSIDLQNRPPHKPLTYGYIYPPQVAVQACAWSRNPLSSTWVASAGASGLLRIENVAP